MPTAESVFPISRFAEFLAHARQPIPVKFRSNDAGQIPKYCDPFVPYVGPRYGEGVRLVYCGVAVRQDKDYNLKGEDADLYRMAKQWSAEIAEAANSNSAFWRLLDQVTLLAFGGAEFALERRRRIVWSNLSKLGVSGNFTAPPDNDRDLRKMDADQLISEVEGLRPDLFLCVSGSRLVDTGKAVFDGWPKVDFEPTASDDTWIRRTPNGGWLYWTGHPRSKPNQWTEAVLNDLAIILQRI